MSQYSQPLQDALRRGVINRLPLTFLPFVNQQLDRWDSLFPNERKAVEHLLVYVAGMNNEQSPALFRDVVVLEEKMGVRRWRFSTREQTIENSSELARSPYFQEWRRAVQAVFDAAERNAQRAQPGGGAVSHRLVLLEIPANLPLHGPTAWSRWQGIGTVIKLDSKSALSPSGCLGRLLAGTDPDRGLLRKAQNRAAAAHADVWVIDAGRELIDDLKDREAASAAAPVLLSYSRLDAYRENFSREMNGMRKDLEDADAVFDRLRKVDVSGWCPPEVEADPAVREFVRSVYLGGNGAVIFGNSFVEWAASEALRRARPSFLAARFGLRK